MAVNSADCNVKFELKRLAMSISKNTLTSSGMDKVNQRIRFTKMERRCERKAWTTLLLYLNSPYVVKQDNFVSTEIAVESDFQIYNELMSKAFVFKVQRKTKEGLRIEELAESFKSAQINPKIIKLLLSLSQPDSSPAVEDFQRIYSFSIADSGFPDDSFQKSSFSSWISTTKNSVASREKEFFQVGLLPNSVGSRKTVFSETPAGQFLNCTSSPHNNANSKTIKNQHERLFGALTNQQPTESDNSLNMVLSLPEMSQDTSSLIIRPKLKSISIDEGFIDDNTSVSSSDFVESQQSINDDLQIWSDCLTSTVQLKYTWERLTGFPDNDCTKYFCESGPIGMDHLYNLRFREATFVTEQNLTMRFISQNEVMKHAVNVLIGLPSKSFHFIRGRCSFIVDSSLRISGVSPDALQELLERFAKIGAYYRQLNRFTQHHSEKLTGLSGGLTLEAFVTSLRKYIESYKQAVLLIQDKIPTSLLQLWAIFDDLGLQMKFLADICLCSAAFKRTDNAPRPKFPMGLKLLSYIYDLCTKNKTTRHYSMLLHLYKDTSLPFLRYITNWIFDGICRDPYNEFLLDVDDQYLCYRDKHYWSHGYVLKPCRKDFEMFSSDFIDQIHACGKAINLLKLTNQKHYLLQDLQRPSIGIWLSTYDLERLQEDNAAYVTRVKQAKAEQLQSKKAAMDELLLKKKEEHEEEKRRILQSMKRINDIERKVKESIQQKKLEELQRLKKQMEDALEKRKMEKEIKLKEDKEFMENLVAVESEKDEETRKAREQMLAYYEELSNKAIERESRALWGLRRLELHQKRREFLKNEELALQEEQKLAVPVENMEDRPDNLPGPTALEEHSVFRGDVSKEGPDSIEVLPSSGEAVEHMIRQDDDSFDRNKTRINVDSIEESQQKQSEPGIASSDQDLVKEDDDSNAETKSGQEGNEAKKLLYGSGKMQFDVVNKPSRKLWDIEKSAAIQEKTEMKGLLYPDSNNDPAEEDVWKSTRGQEPVSRAKKILYFDEDNATNDEENKIESFTDNEIFLDLEVEPLPTDFKAMNDPPMLSLFDKLTSDVTTNEAVDALSTDDVIDHLSLEMIIDRSIIGPIYAQMRLVQTAAVEYFTETLRIGLHFDAFRKFLLLEDGEFGHSLCNEIFRKAFSSVTPKEFCRPTILNNMINKAMQFSVFADKVESASQLTFALKWIPDVIRTTDIASLDFLQLRYKVPWPCNIIITENCIIKYNKIFSFLLRLKMVNWALRRVWKNLKRAGHNSKTAASPQLRQLQLFRHEMQHFVNNVERYLVNQIIHISWQEFQDDLKGTVHNVDDLHKSHVGYLNRIIFRSLLSKNAAPVLKIITDIFSLILKFDFQLLSSQWKENEVGHVNHPAFALMCATHKAFKEYTAFLFKVVSKLIRRGYQHHLDDFLLQVNFNGFYEHAVA